MGVNSGEPSFFNRHILSPILRKNRYNKWTKFEKTLIVLQLTQAV